MNQLFQRLYHYGERFAGKLFRDFREHTPVIVSHTDPDGQIAGALLRVNPSIPTLFMDYFDITTISGFIKAEKADMLVVSDFGSKAIIELAKTKGLKRIYVVDHHDPLPLTDKIAQFNGYWLKMDYSTEICSGSSARLLRGFYKNSIKLDIPALVAAVGDCQDRSGYYRFRGFNRDILMNARNNGLIILEANLCFAGKRLKPLVSFIAHGKTRRGSPLPEVGNNYHRSRCFIEEECGIDGAYELKYYHLPKPHRMRLIAGIEDLLNRHSLPLDIVFHMEIYTKDYPAPNWTLTDISILQGAAGRRGAAETVFSLYERGNLERPLEKYEKYKRDISLGYSIINEILRINVNTAYFSGLSHIPHYIVPPITTSLVYGEQKSRVVMGMAQYDHNPDMTRVSLRTNPYFYPSINLSGWITKMTDKIGGEGGGRRHQAGAWIPSKMTDFLIKSFVSSFRGVLP